MTKLNVELEVPDNWIPGDCCSCPYEYGIPYETEDDGWDEDRYCGIDNSLPTCPLKKAFENNGWVYVIDDMPMVHVDGRWHVSDPVLVCTVEGEKLTAVYRESFDDEPRWINYETGGLINRVIAWMPLPKLPREKDEAE